MPVRSSARRARPRAEGPWLRRAARALPPAAARNRLRPGAARSAVPHGAARRVRRRREPGRGDPGRRRLAAARGEVVLLGRRCRPVPRDRPAARRAGGDPRASDASSCLAPAAVPDPPAEGQARDARSRPARSSSKARPRIRSAAGGVPHRGRRPEHLPLAERLGSAGLMRLVASEFAREREAFGRVISDYPLVRENLAVMKAEADGALASTMELTELVDRIDKVEAGGGGRRLAPLAREREQVRDLAGGDEGRSGAASRRSEATGRSRTSRRCPGSTATRSSSRAGRGRTTSSARRCSATSPGWTPSISSSSAAAVGGAGCTPATLGRGSRVRSAAQAPAARRARALAAGQGPSLADDPMPRSCFGGDTSLGWDPENDADYPDLIDRVAQADA